MKAAAADRRLFLSRELSWLEFNRRVLEEARDPGNFVLDRLNFLAITGGNLDEFFMIRVAGMRRLLRADRDLPDPAGFTVSEQLRKLRKTVLEMISGQQRCLAGDILPELEARGIRLRRVKDLPREVRLRLAVFFEHRVKPVLTPLIPDETQPFPVLNSGTMAVAARLGSGEDEFLALVAIPDVLARFIPADEGSPGRTFVLLEDLILDRLPCLFPRCTVRETLLFRVTRDMDFSVPDDSVEDLLQSIAGQLELRRGRAAIRLEHSPGSGELLRRLSKALDLDEQFCYETEGVLDLQGFAALGDLIADDALREEPWLPSATPELPDDVPVLDAMKRAGSFISVLPYQSFSPVVRMLEEAACDPDVLAVKQTLYRVSGNSPVVRALRQAAENGKQVTVVVELKARFDERNNLVWAQALEESGARVICGIPGLKVHAKALLIIRREEGGALKRYVHLSTGNYNDRTAAVYTDVGLFSADPGLGLDVEKLFNAVTAYTGMGGAWRHIRVSPFDLRRRFYELIDRETEHAKAGKKARIRAKMNSLSDSGIIRRLHRAAKAGVEIELLVRGICCLRPPRQGDKLRVTSIVDRYLEHSRIFEFFNGGDTEFYLSSADWMSRNLDRRIEVLFPVSDPRGREILRGILDLHFADDCKARHLLHSGAYTSGGRGPHRSQKEIRQFISRMCRNGDTPNT